MRFDIGAAQTVGSRRDQQDSFGFAKTPEGFRAVVCDGMGGVQLGAQSSQTAVKVLGAMYREKLPSVPFPSFFRDAVSRMDKAVRALAMDEEGEDVGTTLITAAAEGNKMWWASVGDSRLYLIRRDGIHSATQDHNYFLILNENRRQGRISDENYRSESVHGEALVSYIGMDGVDLIDMNDDPFPLIPGDRLLLMSDGLYRSVSEQEMFDLATSSDDVQKVADTLLERSIKNADGRQDNTTLIVIFCWEDDRK